MLTTDASWLVEEPVLDEPADLSILPEIRQHIVREPHDDELGLRSLLETLEAPPSPWWCEEPHHGRRMAARRRKQRPDLATAA
jgi:hypothetical protein